MTVRDATERDVAAVLALIRELADYERSLHEVVATEDQLRGALFAEQPAAHVLVAEDAGGDGADGATVVGFALWYPTFSTWLGRPGLWLEDLYVRPALRGQGLGRALMAALAGICLERGYPRLEWWVLDWNAPAIGFYRSLGATAMDEWTVQRLEGGALQELGHRRQM